MVMLIVMKVVVWCGDGSEVMDVTVRMWFGGKVLAVMIVMVFI